jgi:hypothetical protein
MAAPESGASAVRALLKQAASGPDKYAPVANYRLSLVDSDAVDVSMDPARVQSKLRLVSVILSSSQPMLIDTRDTLARRLFGGRLADALHGVSRQRGFQALAVALWLLLAALFPAVMLQKVRPTVGLLVFLLNSVMIGVMVLSRFCCDILAILVRRFDFWFLLAHLTVIASGAALFTDPLLGLFWLLVTLVGPLTLCWDSVAQRSVETKMAYATGLLICLMQWAGLFFDLLPVEEVHLRLFSESVSANERVMSSAICFAFFVARYTLTSMRNPENLVIAGSLRSVKVSSRAAEHLCEAFSKQASHMESAKAFSAAHPRRRPGPGPRQVAGGAYRDDAAGAVPGAPQSDDAIASLLAGAARAALHTVGGDQAAARGLLVAIIDELLAESAGARGLRERARSFTLQRQRQLADKSFTLQRQRQLADEWQSHAAGDNEKSMRIVLPRFAPVIVDSRRTFAAALGGVWLNDLCWRIGRSPRFTVASMVTVPLGYCLFVYMLAASDPDVLLPFSVVFGAAFLLQLVQLLLLNTEVLWSIVLPRFTTWWSIGNALLCAAAGSVTFLNPAFGLAWAVVQSWMTTYFLQDAAPLSQRARRVLAISLACYAFFQVYAV